MFAKLCYGGVFYIKIVKLLVFWKLEIFWLFDMNEGLNYLIPFFSKVGFDKG